MSSLHHSFDIELAIELGDVNLAILIHHFQFWIHQNKRLNRNQHDGRTWTYQTLDELAAVFPYWSRDQVFRFLRKAMEKGVLIKGNYNKSSYDRTAWYAFQNEEKFSISRIRKMEIAESQNGYDEIATPIPDTKPDTKPYKKTTTPTPKKAQAPKSSPRVVVFSTPEWDSIIEVCKNKKADLLLHTPRSQDEIENAAKAFKQQIKSGEVRNPFGLLKSLLKEKANPNVPKQQVEIEDKEKRLALAVSRRQECERLYRGVALPNGSHFHISDYCVQIKTPHDPNLRSIGFADDDFWQRLEGFMKKISIAPKPRCVD